MKNLKFSALAQNALNERKMNSLPYKFNLL